MIAIVGSLNLDLVASVPHHPVPGETVLGRDIAEHPGGKGANQAVAAARLGGRVALVGRVGTDEAADTMREAVGREGVDITYVAATPGRPTGRALVTVDPAGENSIVVAPGANTALSVADIEAAEGVLRAARVTVLQQEVPAAANRAAVRLAGGLVVHNPAPAVPDEESAPDGVDLLVPNRTELAALAGSAVPRTIDEVVAAARGLHGPAAVAVTLGADGVVLLEGTAWLHIPAFPVRPADTTGAGDGFCGALAVALAEGRTLEEAARWACAAAALSTTRPGAQPSLARRAEVEEFLARHGG